MRATAILAILPLLAACGGEPEPEAEDPPAMPGAPLTQAKRTAYDAPPAPGQQAGPDGPAFPGFGGGGEQALEIATKPQADCAAARPAEGPRSVAGLAVGMTAGEAVRLLACDEGLTRMTESGDYRYGGLDRRGFALRTEIAAADGRACTRDEQPSITDVSRNRSMGNPPLPCEPDRVFGDFARDVTEQVRVRVLGVPGEEVVYGLHRETTYEGEARPALQAVRDRLVARYGEPTQEDRSGQSLNLGWSRDASGRLLSPAQADPECRLGTRLGLTEDFVEGCGVQVAATLVEASDAPLLEELRVAILDEDGLLEAIARTDAALAAMRAAGDAEAVAGAADADELDL